MNDTNKGETEMKLLNKVNQIIAAMTGIAMVAEVQASFIRLQVLPGDISSQLGRLESATIKAEQLAEELGIEISVAI
jgi:hypothetical protein